MIRSAVLCVLLALLLASWCQPASSPRGEVLTLEQAVALAVQNNVNVKNAALSLGQSEDQLTAIRTQRLPNLKLVVSESHLLTPIDLTFKEGAFGTFPGVGPIPADRTTLCTDPRFATDVYARAAQPLSQLYRIGLSIEQSEVNRDLSLK
jgi:hypothetical protein